MQKTPTGIQVPSSANEFKIGLVYLVSILLMYTYHSFFYNKLRCRSTKSENKILENHDHAKKIKFCFEP
jgi:predicted membrane channel-forming protein YqfA (hemolysin III family)